MNHGKLETMVQHPSQHLSFSPTSEVWLKPRAEEGPSTQTWTKTLPGVQDPQDQQRGMWLWSPVAPTLTNAERSLHTKTWFRCSSCGFIQEQFNIKGKEQRPGLAASRWVHIFKWKSWRCQTSATTYADVLQHAWMLQQVSTLRVCWTSTNKCPTCWDTARGRRYQHIMRCLTSARSLHSLCTITQLSVRRWYIDSGFTWTYWTPNVSCRGCSPGSYVAHPGLGYPGRETIFTYVLTLSPPASHFCRPWSLTPPAKPHKCQSECCPRSIHGTGRS